jgi:hypothetical protein
MIGLSSLLSRLELGGQAGHVGSDGALEEGRLRESGRAMVYWRYEVLGAFGKFQGKV